MIDSKVVFEELYKKVISHAGPVELTSNKISFFFAIGDMRLTLGYIDSQGYDSERTYKFYMDVYVNDRPTQMDDLSSFYDYSQLHNMYTYIKAHKGTFDVNTKADHLARKIAPQLGIK